jgi:hypothetical protein
MAKHKRRPECKLVGEGKELFLHYDGRAIAKRGSPETPQKKHMQLGTTVKRLRPPKPAGQSHVTNTSLSTPRSHRAEPKRSNAPKRFTPQTSPDNPTH